MRYLIMVKNSELWDVICDSPYVPMKVVKEDKFSQSVMMARKDYNKGDKINTKRIKWLRRSL